MLLNLDSLDRALSDATFAFGANLGIDARDGVNYGYRLSRTNIHATLAACAITLVHKDHARFLLSAIPKRFAEPSNFIIEQRRSKSRRSRERDSLQNFTACPGKIRIALFESPVKVRALSRTKTIFLACATARA
jgi:hypothetical protein